MAEGEMVTKNFISSKARPVARNLKVNANRSRQHLHYHRNIRKHNAYRNIQRGKTEKAF